MKQSNKAEAWSVLVVLILSLWIAVRAEAADSRSNSVVTVRAFTVPTGWVIQSGNSLKIRKLAKSNWQAK